MRREDVDVLQRQENAAMRRMLGAPRNATIAGMRGDIGIGTMRSRIVRGRLQYFRRVKQGENRLLGRIMVNAQRRGSEWMKEMRRHMDSGLGWCQGRGFGSNDEGTGEEENSRGGTSGVEE